MLRTKRPTPTTVLYTVSSKPSATTLATRFLALCSILLRLAAGLLVLTTVLHDYQTRNSNSNLPILPLLDNLSAVLLNGNPALQQILRASTRPHRWAFCALATYAVLRRYHTTESLLVIRGLGVQTSTSSALYVGAASTRFIPTSSIQDVFIHEAFKGFEVRFYLSIVVQGEEGVVVVFPVSSRLARCSWEADD